MKRFLVIMGLLTLLTIAGAFILGANWYESKVRQVLDHHTTEAHYFEETFDNTVSFKKTMLSLGLDLIRNHQPMMTAFAQSDRGKLLALTQELFDRTLKPNYGLQQFHFILPPAKSFLRVNAPQSYGDDMSGYRKMVLTTNELKAPHIGFEIGSGGVALRAISPIAVQGEHVGCLELGIGFKEILAFTHKIVAVDYAVALHKKALAGTRRKPNDKTDVLKGKYLFYIHSSPEVKSIIQASPEFFNASTLNKGLITEVNDQKYFMKKSDFTDFSGQPAGIILMVSNLSRELADLKTSIWYRVLAIFILVWLVGFIAVLKFKRIRQGFEQIIHKRAREFEEKQAAFDKLRGDLEDFENLKRRFLAYVSRNLQNPLSAFLGHLKGILPTLETDFQTGSGNNAQRLEILSTVRFMVAETNFMLDLLTTYHQIERFRLGELLSVKNEAGPLKALLDKALDDIRIVVQNSPAFKIQLELEEDLPPVKLDAQLLARLMANLIRYVLQKGEAGTIRIAAQPLSKIAIQIKVTGTAFDKLDLKEIPDEVTATLLDLSAVVDLKPLHHFHLGLVFARLLIGQYGGSFAVISLGPDKGFQFTLPTHCIVEEA